MAVNIPFFFQVKYTHSQIFQQEILFNVLKYRTTTETEENIL